METVWFSCSTEDDKEKCVMMETGEMVTDVIMSVSGIRKQHAHSSDVLIHLQDVAKESQNIMKEVAKHDVERCFVAIETEMDDEIDILLIWIEVTKIKYL